MNDEQKTKKELVEELEAMRRQVAAMKSEIERLKSEKTEEFDDPVFRQPRREFNGGIEFIADFDIIKAQGVNISEGGICFDIDDDLPFEMQFRHEKKLHRHRAYLVWVKRLSEGGYRFGLKFAGAEDGSEPQF